MINNLQDTKIQV